MKFILILPAILSVVVAYSAFEDVESTLVRRSPGAGVCKPPPGMDRSKFAWDSTTCTPVRINSGAGLRRRSPGAGVCKPPPGMDRSKFAWDSTTCTPVRINF
ncbi:MAG: hypothetical protein DHS80DRAFT_22503 [Piptocephalis tieghemiana]|nr:MAG: hypothetical protein DHS80DRAFT_22503 [Piptocephalis tieghemiana]